ncbi:unnamed protein product [Cladocopium goreaui]|uniref:Voltage-dependent T-type calcium channel subunit alpha-1I n=1 Tax=Cladocopium goreaui TaxID=2562237 RepID=A0A9P1FWS1_9DINO|nr:unnamed protein product [Cladocopium goreaui]
MTGRARLSSRAERAELVAFVEAQHAALLRKLSDSFEPRDCRDSEKLGLSAINLKGEADLDPRSKTKLAFESAMTVQPTAPGNDSYPDFAIEELSQSLESEVSEGSGVASVVGRRASWKEALEVAMTPGSMSPRRLKDVLLSKGDAGDLHLNIEPYLESVTVILVLLNAIVLGIEYQVEGEVVGLALLEGKEPTSVAASTANVFYWFDFIFDFTFLLEWAICLCIARKRFCFTVELVANTILVMFGCAEMFLILLQNSGVNVSLTALHIIHAVSCLRILRCFRVLRRFQGPKLLLTACNSFLHSLFWAMVFLSLFMSTSALFIGNLLLKYFVDTRSMADRLWVWERYGTSFRAIYTLYEITFSGSWPSLTHPVIDKVHAAMVIFFVAYITVVAFGLIRVITAVFLKATLDAAADDAEHLMTERLVKKEQYARKLEAIFGAIDEEGDGQITEERLVEALERPLVRTYFQTSLDLDVHESKALFHILDDGDGTVTLEEFIDGMLRCKGNARAIDQVATQREIKHLDRKMSRLLMVMESTTASERINRPVA